MSDLISNAGRWLRLATIALPLALFACGDDGSTGPSIMCTSDVQCPGALSCLEGVCQLASCSNGNEGCACSAGDRCARGADGSQLVCTEGICTSMTCPAGDGGCACIDGMSCNAEGDVCADGYCVASECEDGTNGCPCVAGSCDAGLYCLNGAVCVDDDGYEGGPCLASERCNPGARCDTTLDTCVYCEAGSEGCSCDGMSCNDGLACVAGLCIAAIDLPPVDPKCYTPCRSDLVTDSETRVCGRDGLLEGCVGDLSCNGGSCVAEEEVAPTCETDLECPFFQTCLTGGCYSTCESNSECPVGMGCHKRVCRVPCETAAGADTCGAGMRCDSEDGSSGYCIQSDTTVGGGNDEDGDDAAFSVDQSQLAFSNVRTERSFTLTATGENVRRTFTIRRLWHELTDADGTTTRVEAERDPITGELAPCDAVAGECPLWWLDISTPDAGPSMDPEIEFDAFGGCEDSETCPEITVAGAGGVTAARWSGALEITSSAGGQTTLRVTYVERPEGQWVGTMNYFGSFPDDGVSEWIARSDKRDVSGVGNGLIRRWGAFRSGSLAEGWQEMFAVLTSTRTESWAFAEVQSRCPAGEGACYPYTNTLGVRTFVTNLENTPIPRGVSEFPFAMNLRLPGLTATQLEGRIETNHALHYPGDPAVAISLSADPSLAESCDGNVTTDCVVWMDSMDATAIVGGRYYSADGSCASGFVAVDEPWLVDGFTAGTTEDESGRRSRTLCVDVELPLDTSSDASLADTNRSLAGANPVPDGVARTRNLTLLDGALINQNTIVFLFRESVGTFVDDGSDLVSAYGYVLLTRQPSNLSEDDEDGSGIPDAFEGNTPPMVSRTVPTPTGATCDGTLVDDIVGGTNVGALSSTNLRQLTNVLIGGTDALGGSPIPDAQMHYFCEETGLFDGGPDDDGGVDAVAIPCPVGSRVVYFSTDSFSQADLAGESCQQDVVCEARTDADVDSDLGLLCTGGTCQARLNELELNGLIDVYDPNYVCDDGNTVYCDDDRYDLRAGKTFYSPAPGVNRSFNSLQADIEAAFRYRTRFTSSSGSRVGFAPKVCIPDSDEIPYCYDPAVIEELLTRVDCLVHIYSDDTLWARLDATRQSNLQTFLKGSFAEFTDPNGNRDGFERLYAELLVMQGDEALTKAFASRFDLAGVGGASFEGSLVEPDGIDLSGVAGFEMVSLYQSVQLYQLALDRLYRLGPNFTEALSRNPSVDSPVVFLSAETVVLYIERLIRASTQKARAYSEIAKRYQNFNRPDLARAVVERAYTAAYLEAIIISQLMTSISERSVNADRPQIELTITQAQRRYRMALLDMRNVYSSLTDDINYFGFAPDYVPFPALDASARGRNAFEVLLGSAQAKTQFARVREQEALASNRSFQTDAAQFQSELVRIRNTYDNQLAELCGTFESTYDGRVYPATRAYASRHPWATQLGDPCGRMGNGAIHRALVNYQSSLLAQQQLATRLENTIEEVEIEQQRVSDQCERIVDLADYQYDQAGETRDLRSDINTVRANMEAQNATITATADIVAGMICVPPVITTIPPVPDPSACPNQAIDAGIRGAAALETTANTFVSELVINGKEQEILQIQRQSARWQTLQECDFATIDSNARTATLLLGIRELELEQLRASYESQLALSEIERLFNVAFRTQDEQEEAEGLSIDIEAARNDPNVRVYRNDAIINADVAFNDAIRAAYRLTKVFEYYTSQSYEGLERLFLIRMIGAGEYNLENYLLDLENAFFEFEETYGAPDTRVLQLSLMDDILQIPTLDESGHSISDEDRLAILRERMQDVDLLDSNGYVTIGFSTNLEQLSPLTANHKVLRIEAEMAVTAGDNVGRLYLRQVGTGVVRGLDEEIDFFVFPERTAVLNPYFNGSRPYTDEVYQNTRFRDRPLVNTNWELVFNQRDELENRDIQLDTLADIRLYVYYQDFTAF